MGMDILILKNAGYASLMLMGIIAKDHTWTYKFIMFYRIEEVKGLNFFKKGGVTYVIGQEVHWIFFS